jgi:hypothetical protein
MPSLRSTPVKPCRAEMAVMCPRQRRIHHGNAAIVGVIRVIGHQQGRPGGWPFCSHRIEGSASRFAAGVALAAAAETAADCDRRDRSPPRSAPCAGPTGSRSGPRCSSPPSGNNPAISCRATSATADEPTAHDRPCPQPQTGEHLIAFGPCPTPRHGNRDRPAASRTKDFRDTGDALYTAAGASRHASRGLGP